MPRVNAARFDLGGQPDSVAASPDGAYGVVATENEREEDLSTETPPQLPAGSVVVVNTAREWKDGSAGKHFVNQIWRCKKGKNFMKKERDREDRIPHCEKCKKHMALHKRFVRTLCAQTYDRGRSNTMKN